MLTGVHSVCLMHGHMPRPHYCVLPRRGWRFGLSQPSTDRVPHRSVNRLCSVCLPEGLQQVSVQLLGGQPRVTSSCLQQMPPGLYSGSVAIQWDSVGMRRNRVVSLSQVPCGFQGLNEEALSLLLVDKDAPCKNVAPPSSDKPQT